MTYLYQKALSPVVPHLFGKARALHREIAPSNFPGPYGIPDHSFAGKTWMRCMIIPRSQIVPLDD